jgi:hypothetical protein
MDHGTGDTDPSQSPVHPSAAGQRWSCRVWLVRVTVGYGVAVVCADAIGCVYMTVRLLLGDVSLYIAPVRLAVVAGLTVAAWRGRQWGRWGLGVAWLLTGIGSLMIAPFLGTRQPGPHDVLAVAMVAAVFLAGAVAAFCPCSAAVVSCRAKMQGHDSSPRLPSQPSRPPQAKREA